jgi:hypothetical protein
MPELFESFSYGMLGFQALGIALLVISLSRRITRMIAKGSAIAMRRRSEDFSIDDLSPAAQRLEDKMLEAAQRHASSGQMPQRNFGQR